MQIEGVFLGLAASVCVLKKKPGRDARNWFRHDDSDKHIASSREDRDFAESLSLAPCQKDSCAALSEGSRLGFAETDRHHAASVS